MRYTVNPEWRPAPQRTLLDVVNTQIPVRTSPLRRIVAKFTFNATRLEDQMRQSAEAFKVLADRNKTLRRDRMDATIKKANALMDSMDHCGGKIPRRKP